MKLGVAALAIATFAVGANAQDFVKGRMIVKFKASTTAVQAEEAIKKVNGKTLQNLPALGLKVVELPPNANEKAQAKAFGQRADVEFAEPDYKFKASVLPNDPSFGSQWHLPKISAPSAWDLSLGSGVTIAILDSGVAGWHADLAGQMVAGWNFVNGNSDTTDVNGHGTMVAGVAAAVTNNLTGVSGVGWNCKIMPLRISDANGIASATNMAAALQYAADHGAKVANVSFPASGSSTIRTAAQYFMNHGGVVAMSSGNTGAFDSTADNPYVLSVSATDSNDNVAGFSTTGNFIDLAAPGDGIYTTDAGGGYSWGSGTSFSAPVVAGVTALMFSSNPNLSSQQVYDLVKQNADDLGAAGWDPGYGAGRVNASRAVSAASTAAAQDLVAPVVSFAAPATKSIVAGSVNVFCDASDNVAVDRVLLYVDSTLVGTKYSASYSWSWDSNSVVDGAHTLKAVAYDLAGNSASTSISITVKNTVDTIAPTVSITSPSSGSSAGSKVNVSISASDNLGVTKVDLFVDGKLSNSSTRAPYQFSLSTRKWARGAHTLQAKAYDAAGNVGVSSIVTVNY